MKQNCKFLIDSFRLIYAIFGIKVKVLGKNNPECIFCTNFLNFILKDPYFKYDFSHFLFRGRRLRRSQKAF